MSSFWVYLEIGLQHITDVQGYDHILFILALMATFSYKNFKQVVWLVTAFTLGHTITLGLSTLGILSINPELVENLIPITILLVCISNFFGVSKLTTGNRPSYIKHTKTYKKYYVEAVFFGLIHGLGFSNYLKALLGSESSIWEPLLAFNLGLELGQLLIVVTCLLINNFVMKFTLLNQRDWNFFLTGGAFVSAVIILVN
ncbi:HupE/UreJ family protein [Flammeovirga pectinis]|uniref:HupE/UreJ family protein n=1 Tax=Flammeovirga pectinis TaxID=2494373 RepID=A0A3Q9FNU1_9BACT|nr:HupE/UreJ family protein [Flammeovirga pectinis]AZQ62505.1 HupE/UreJ family protein [Flammeovirga pectinis]